VLAFSLAGVATGGAVAATGVLTPSSSVVISMEEMQTVSFPGTEILGAPLVISGSGETVVELGPRPDGATALSLYVGCIDAGRYKIAIDDLSESFVECDKGSGDADSLGGSSSQLELGAEQPQTLIVHGASADRYVVWVAWSAPPVTPGSSQAQVDALADGVVTREEYVAGLDRYIACMEASGWSVGVLDREAEVIDYRIEAISGADDLRCYATEFYELDAGWQVSRE
jgi:hypothetical protein